MNRLALFSIFDEEGIVDEYVYYLLQELQSVANKVVVIINGNITSSSWERLQEYSVQVIQRENVGFDAGAYKDILFNHIGIDNVKKYDELILCNDTFYGPFVHLKEIWKSFDAKNIDFWGLHFLQLGYSYCVSSFFLVFRKKILLDDRFYEYWNKNIDITCKDIKLVYATFESGLFYELCDMGYRYDTYADKGDYHMMYHIMLCPDYMIKKYNAPFIKKKAFSDRFFHSENINKALLYVTAEKDYEIDLIYKSVSRKYGCIVNNYMVNKKDCFFEEHKIINADYVAKDLFSLKTFCNTWYKETIYIFGAGSVASKIYFILRKNIKNFGGFIVSKIDNEKVLFGQPVIGMNSISLENKCIIIGLNPENTDEVRSKIPETNKIFYIWKKKSLSQDEKQPDNTES